MKKKRSKKTGNATGQLDPGAATTQPSRSPTTPAHPHDHLFKEIFSTREAQQDLVRMALPAEIISRFRMETVRDASEELAGVTRGRADLLLTVETTDGTTEYVYVLVEHKSYLAQMVAVQLLGYVAGIMRKHGKAPVPVIHPVVLYHGEKPWTTPTELTGLHRATETARPVGSIDATARNHSTSPQHQPSDGYPVNLRYHLVDLSMIPPEEIAERARARAAAGMIAMKYIKRKLDAGDIRVIARVVVRSSLPDDLWHTITTYVFDHVEARYRQSLMTAIEENVYTETEGIRMRSIADALREEGVELGLTRGLERGLEQGKADVLVRQLRRRFGLTDGEEVIVRECHDAERLDEAAEACVDPEAGKEDILAVLS